MVEMKTSKRLPFLKEMNEVVYGTFPDAITIAEESTSWTGVSKPTYLGGLGFGQKWMMGWMHDTLHYFQLDPIHRRHHQNEITFSIMYAFTENFMLPLSHDEVVHGKGSLLGRMPGDEWKKFANLRLLFAYMFAHPGTKLIFMGGEIRAKCRVESRTKPRLAFAGLRRSQRCAEGDQRSQCALYDVSRPCISIRLNTADSNGSTMAIRKIA